MKNEQKAYLVLENGAVFEGKRFGAKGNVAGEVVFTTGMTGYLETLTDPSYAGQIIVQTFPLIGNYGVIPEDFESRGVQAKAYIVRSWCAEPSNFRSQGEISAFLESQGVVGLCGIDTRALTRMIRRHGVMNGRILSDLSDVGKQDAAGNAVAGVSTKKVWRCGEEHAAHRVALLDYGVKNGIARELAERGYGVWVFPHTSTAADVAKIRPDGITLSNGPGDPAENEEAIRNLTDIARLGIPMFGICLGHQLLALSQGFRTKKLKFGHRGANQPVKELATGRVYITSQNHGYAVCADSIDAKIAKESFANVNDGTCEGLEYSKIPAFTVQFHPEACGGPRDTRFLFDRFAAMMGGSGHAAR